MAFHFNTRQREGFFTEQVRYESAVYMAPHRDLYSRISIVVDGTMNEIACGEQVSIRGGNVIIKPKHVVHENMFSKKPVNLLTICFTDNSLFEHYFDHWQVTYRPNLFQAAFRLWAALHKALRNDDSRNALDEFARHLLPVNELQNTGLHWVKELERLLKENLTEAESIACLAEKLALHRVYMGRAFKKAVGLSPVAYRNEARLASALIALVTTGESLASIAFETGFADQSHLTRSLRTATGSTPHIIRKLLNG